MTGGDLELRVAWQQHVGTGRVADGWYESVVTRHREAHRHYHDIRHVRWVVRHVRALTARRSIGGRDHAGVGVDAGVDADVGAAVVAAFFHDIVYDPTASDNERASAELAAQALGELQWNDERNDRVAAMIRGTAGHHVDDTMAIEAAVLYAADLGVLAADPAGYSDYVRNVRREYGHLSDAVWADGRTEVLRSFLGRAAIYAPILGLEAWEQRARGNLTAELGTLVR